MHFCSIKCDQSTFFLFSGSLKSQESCKVLSQKCFSGTQSENLEGAVCKSGSTLENYGVIPTDKNYCEIQPDQSIGEKTWAECDDNCPTATNDLNGKYLLFYFYFILLLPLKRCRTHLIIEHILIFL